eukprot:3553590-Prymnesium_polylepis.1
MPKPNPGSVGSTQSTRTAAVRIRAEGVRATSNRSCAGDKPYGSMGWTRYCHQRTHAAPVNIGGTHQKP